MNSLKNLVTRIAKLNHDLVPKLGMFFHTSTSGNTYIKTLVIIYIYVYILLYNLVYD